MIPNKHIAMKSIYYEYQTHPVSTGAKWRYIAFTSPNRQTTSATSPIHETLSGPSLSNKTTATNDPFCSNTNRHSKPFRANHLRSAFVSSSSYLHFSFNYVVRYWCIWYGRDGTEPRPEHCFKGIQCGCVESFSRKSL